MLSTQLLEQEIVVLVAVALAEHSVKVEYEVLHRENVLLTTSRQDTNVFVAMFSVQVMDVDVEELLVETVCELEFGCVLEACQVLVLLGVLSDVVGLLLGFSGSPDFPGFPGFSGFPGFPGPPVPGPFPPVLTTGTPGAIWAPPQENKQNSGNPGNLNEAMGI